VLNIVEVQVFDQLGRRRPDSLLQRLRQRLAPEFEFSYDVSADGFGGALLVAIGARELLLRSCIGMSL
jgi:hypothetical protein